MYKEYFDTIKLKAIIDNFETLKSQIREEVTDGAQENYGSPLETVLSNYLKASKPINDKHSCISVTYNKSKNSNGYGRMFSHRGLSLQSLPREIRHTISNELYVDIDIVNCHPNLLIQYAEKNNLRCKYIKLYSDNREDFFKKFKNECNLDRDYIKKSILAILNGSPGKSILKKTNNNRLFKKLIKEVEAIHTYIYDNEKEYRKIGDKNALQKQKNGGFYNPKGSTCNVMLCDIENKILNCMINYLQENQYINNDVVLVFDGFMMLREHLLNKDIENIMRELETEVYEQLKYNIQLTVKMMNQTIEISNELLNKVKLQKNDKPLIAMNDDDASIILLNIIKDNIIKCETKLYYKYNNIWITNEKEIDNLLKLKLAELNIRKYKVATKEDIKEGFTTLYNGIPHCLNKFIDYSKNISNAEDIIKSLKTKVKEDNDFIEKIYRTTKGKICFNNGYYDLLKGQFIDNFNGVYTTRKLNRDYKPNFIQNNKELIESIFNRILKPIVGESLLDSILLFTSRTLGGFTNDKLYGLLMGERDSGKSKYKNLVENAFESYVGIVDMNSLLFSNNNQDESKKLSWLYDNWDRRLLFGSEVRMDKESNFKIDGALLKKLCSGSDKIKMRKNFKDDTDFYIQCSLLLMANDLPIITPSDTYEKMVPYQCPHKFMKKIEPEDLIENPHYKLADNSIDDFVFDKLVGEAFIYIILNSFKNESVSLNEKQQEFIENVKVEDELKQFNEHFTITRNKEDKVTTMELKEFLASNKKINMSYAKLSIILNNRGCTFKKSIKINNKVTTGFIGIKKIINYNNDDNGLDI